MKEKPLSRHNHDKVDGEMKQHMDEIINENHVLILEATNHTFRKSVEKPNG